MHHRTFQQAFVAGGALCVILFFGAFVAAHFIPPMSPSLSAAEVAEHYRAHAGGIRLGGILMMLSSLFYAGLVAVIGAQMRRIPTATPAAAYAQLVGGAFACLTFFLPGLLFIVTAYRPERDPAITQALNDMSWIWLVIAWPPFLVQYWAFSYAVLGDRSPAPLFPRWLGYFNMWAVLCFVPATALPYFRTGPFAWNGLIVFWVPATVFTAWFIANVALLGRAVASDDTGTTQPVSARSTVVGG
ncbi:MAG TPA: hypothetical protein VNS55_09580 [Nocardioides sp.]|nr:hypothetical protein [Nocardioides sp.]